MLWKFLENKAGAEASADQLNFRGGADFLEEYSYAVRAKDADGEILEIGQSYHRFVPQSNGDLLLHFNSKIPGIQYAEEIQLLVDAKLKPRHLAAKIELPRVNYYEIEAQYNENKVTGEITFQSNERSKIERSLVPATYDSYENFEILRRCDYGRHSSFLINLINVAKGAYNRYLVRYNGVGKLRIDNSEYEAFKISLEKVVSREEERFIQYYWFLNQPPYHLLRHLKAAQILELIR